MRTSNEKEIKLKTGILPVGDITSVTVEKERPSVAILWSSSQNREIKVRSTRLHKWFPDFEAIEMGELEEAISDGVCTSLCGYNVEPDGWDSKGFPSKLLAAGLC